MEFSDGLHRLAEYLDHGNPSYVLHRLMIHCFQGILISLHEFHAVFPHQGALQEESNAKKQQEGNAYPPVKGQHQDQADDHCDLRTYQIRKLVSDKGFCLEAVFINDFPQFTAGV